MQIQNTPYFMSLHLRNESIFRTTFIGQAFEKKTNRGQNRIFSYTNWRTLTGCYMLSHGFSPEVLTVHTSFDAFSTVIRIERAVVFRAIRSSTCSYIYSYIYIYHVRRLTSQMRMCVRPGQGHYSHIRHNFGC